MLLVDSGGAAHRQCTLTGNAAGIAYVCSFVLTAADHFIALLHIFSCCLFQCRILLKLRRILILAICEGVVS